MQCRDGGWGAFDVDNTRTLCRELPFCDFGELIDPPSADVTAHVVEMLAVARAGRADAVDRGVRVAARAPRRRTARGSGAGAPTTSTAPAPWSRRSSPPGLAPAHPAVRRAVAWLEGHQNADGGWGEDLRSYRDDSYRGRGRVDRLPDGLGPARRCSPPASDRPATERGRRVPRRDPARGRHVGRAVVHRDRLPGRLLHQLPPLPARLPGHGTGALRERRSRRLSSRSSRRSASRPSPSAAPTSSSARGRTAPDAPAPSSPPGSTPTTAVALVGVAGGLAPGPAPRRPRRRDRAARAPTSSDVAAPSRRAAARGRAPAGRPRRPRRAARLVAALRARPASAPRSPPRAPWPSTWSRPGSWAALADNPLAVVALDLRHHRARPGARRRPGARVAARGARRRSSAGRAPAASTRWSSPRPGRSAPASSVPSRPSSARSSATGRPSTSAARSSTTCTSCATSRPRAPSSSRSSTRCPRTRSWCWPRTGCRPVVRRQAAERGRSQGHRRDLPARRQGAQRGAPLRRARTTTSSSSATPTTRRSSGPSARRRTASTSSRTSDDVGRLELEPGRPVAYLTQTTLATDETAEIVAALRGRFPEIVGAAGRRHLLRHPEPPGRGAARSPTGAT